VARDPIISGFGVRMRQVVSEPEILACIFQAGRDRGAEEDRVTEDSVGDCLQVSSSP
jgi:hypothetical protein